MTWSLPQQITVHRATTAAGWNDQQRYMAMRRAGCPVDRRTGQPSVKHPRNVNTHFELFMEVAEACAAERGESVPKPREHKTWRGVCMAKHYSAWRAKAEAIAAEAIERLPHAFDKGLIQYAIEHTNPKDGMEHFPPEGLGECTTDHLYRVVECLKAYVGRSFLHAGITPRTFEIPAEARRRAS